MSNDNMSDTNSTRQSGRESTLLPMLIGGLSLALVGMIIIVMFV